MDIEQRKLRELIQPQVERPPVWLLSLIAIGCVAAAFVVAGLVLRIALLSAGVCLIAIAAVGVIRPELVNLGQRRRQREEASLIESVKALVAHDGDAVFLTDMEGEILYRNSAAEDRFGGRDDGLLMNAFNSLLANPDGVLYRLQARSLTLGSAKEDVVTRHGQFRLSVVQITDNAQLWRVDDSLRNSKAQNRAADALSLPMMTVSPKDAVLYINEAFRRILGQRPKSAAEVFGPGELISGQVRVVKTAEGDDEEMMLAVTAGAAGRREVYAIPHKARSASETGPRQLNGSWDAIEDLPVPLLKIDPSGDVLATNREARQLLGLRDGYEKKLTDVLDGLGRPFRDWIAEALGGKAGQASQFLRGRGDRSDTFVQVTLNVAESEGEQQIIAVLNDVTELKSLEAQFVQSQKMHAIGQLAGGVAHDFNNLLTAISGHCDLLLLRHDQGDQDYGDLIQIHQNANRAASLVGQLLAFSRKQNLQPERIDLRDTLSDLTHLLNRLVGEKVQLVLDHDPDLACIKADKRQLEQVMMNLVVNARDAMPQGGRIMVKTENVTIAQPLERDKVTVPAGDYVLVRVSDQGHGIPPDRLPKIFEPFYTTKRTGEGTGLGLSTVYGIVKQTGGYVFATSDLNAGSEFELYFPAHTLQVADPLPPVIDKPALKTSTGEGVILLVEDEAPVRAFASRALRLRGYTVLEADCAEAALSLLEDPDLKVDIFVTDVIMPGMDGPTWVKEALSERPDTKVVFVSGYAEDAFANEETAIPNSVFLPKPFSLTELTTTVQGQLH